MSLLNLDDPDLQRISDLSDTAAYLAEVEEEEKESMERQKQKRILSCQTDGDTGYKMDTLAINGRRTVSSLVAQAVEEFVERQSKAALKRKKK